MGAVASAVKSVVGGVAEAAGAVIGGVADIVSDVGKGIDKYVIQPIKNDPLTAIATIAGAAYLGPVAAANLGVSSAVGAGLGAAAGNFTAGMAQGESFDEAIKGAAIAGLTVGTTKGAFDSFAGDSAIGGPGEVGVDIDAFGNAIDPMANPYVSGLEGATPNLAGTDFAMGPGYGGSEVGVDIDAFGRPIDSMANPYANYTTVPQTPSYLPQDSLTEIAQGGFSPGESLAPEVNRFELLGDKVTGPGLKAQPYQSPSGTYSLTGQSDYSLMGPGGSGTMMGTPDTSWTSKIPTLEDLSSADFYKGLPGKAYDLAGSALDYAIDNPLTTLAGVTLLSGGLAPDIPQGPPPQQGPNESDAEFLERLKLYEYQRSRQGDIDVYNYGYGPEAQFFTPSQFVPIETVANGGRIGYYRYGRQPMQQGGRMINSPLAQYGQGGAHGRSDDVPAVLSDGEYVIDAETVALLGNGSVDAGANQLDRMREEIRRHKGRSLAEGKISPDARSPLNYLKG